MNAQGVRGAPARAHRRRKRMIDLNAPPTENRDQEGTSRADNRQERVADEQGQARPPPMIDVDAIDDDVVESSASAFAEAKNKSRSSRGRAVMVDVDSGSGNGLQVNVNNKRRRVPSHLVIDCDHECINVELTMSSLKGRDLQPPPAPPPPKEPTFTCPICIGPFNQEMSTKCGHIFCKECIRAAIAQQGRCPTCRKKVTVKELIRVFLPATN